MDELLVEKAFLLLKTENYRPYLLSNATGISQSSICSYRKGKAPRPERAKLIVDYFERKANIEKATIRRDINPPSQSEPEQPLSPDNNLNDLIMENRKLLQMLERQQAQTEEALKQNSRLIGIIEKLQSNGIDRTAEKGGVAI